MALVFLVMCNLYLYQRILENKLYVWHIDRFYLNVVVYVNVPIEPCIKSNYVRNCIRVWVSCHHPSEIRSLCLMKTLKKFYNTIWKFFFHFGLLYYRVKDLVYVFYQGKNSAKCNEKKYIGFLFVYQLI